MSVFRSLWGGFLLAVLLPGAVFAAGSAAQQPIVGAGAARAAPSPIDSLRRRLATAPADTTRLALLDATCRALRRDPAAYPYAAEGLALARRLRHPRWEATLLKYLLENVQQRQDYPAVTRYAQQLIRLSQGPPADLLDLAKGYNGLADAQAHNGDLSAARRSYRQAIHYLTMAPPSTRRLRGLAFTYSVLANCSLPPEATAQHSVPDSSLRAARQCLRQLQLLTDSLQAIGDESFWRNHRANVWGLRANLAEVQGQLDSAAYYKRRVVAEGRILGNAPQVAARQQELAALELALGHPALAAAIADSAAQLAQEMTMTGVAADSYRVLAEAYLALNRSAEGRRAMQQAFLLRDSVYSEGKRTDLARLEVAFDTERKEARIKALTQAQRLQAAEAARRRQQLWTLTAVLAALLVGGAVGTVLYVRLRRSRTALAALTATKDRLYALVAHDLRGPVQALDGVAGMFAYYAERPDPREARELSRLVGQAARQVNQLLDNLLYWAASQTGELSFQPAKLAVQLLFDECVALWGNTAQQASVTLSLPPAPVAGTVYADPQMVRTMLRNLVGNAIKFTPAGGTVTLTATTDATGTTLSVRDTGPGLPPGKAAALLAPGAALTTSERGARGESGTGLGLRLCVLFAQRHGGRLTLDPAPGGGTVATVWLPAAV